MRYRKDPSLICLGVLGTILKEFEVCVSVLEFGTHTGTTLAKLFVEQYFEQWGHLKDKLVKKKKWKYSFIKSS